MPKRLSILATALVVALSLYALLGSAPAAHAAPAPWADTLAYGMPSAPTTWQPAHWDTQIHTRDYSAVDPMTADHGADCSAPPATHRITTWQEAVFLCHDHIMTAISSEGYGEVVLTPDHLADWSAGPVTVSFSVSSFYTSQRDWISIGLSPFAEQLALPFDEGDVDLQGMPRDSVQLKLVPNNGAPSWVADQVTGFSENELQHSWDVPPLTQFITPSKTVRTPYEFTFSATRYSLRIAPSSPQAAGQVLLSGTWPKALTWTQGVLQLAHHSYNPTKGDGCGPPDDTQICAANTWHWSDVGISTALPYTLLRPVDHQVISASSGVATFAQAAPAGSFLKFAAIGTVQVSYDGGATYHAAKKPPLDASAYHEEHQTSYLDPMPAGATSARFKLAGGWYGPGYARDFSVVSLSALGGPAPSPTPVPPTATATPVPTSTPTPAPTSTPSPTPSPININGAPCSVTLGGVTRSGTCSGIFTPSS